MTVKRIEMFKRMGLFKTPQSVSELLDIVEGFSAKEKSAATLSMAFTWNLCSVKSAEAFTQLGDIISETLLCFEDYCNSKDGDMAPLAEAHDILKKGAQLIASINGEAYENET